MVLSRLVAIETRRLMGKRVVQALLLLPVVPVIVAAVLRGHYLPVFEKLRSIGIDTSGLWLVALGVTPRGLGRVMEYAAGVMGGMTVLNIASFAWLVAVIFAAYLFASDTASGRLSLLVTRPVSRRGLVAAKTIAAYLVLLLLFLEAGLAAYASFYILAGRQSMPWLIPVYAVLAAAASIPMLAVTGLIGLRSAKSGTTIAAGLVIYFVLSIATSLLALPYMMRGETVKMMRVTSYASAAEPIHSFMLPRLVLDAAVSGPGASYTVSGIDTGITIARLLLVSAAATTVAIIGLVLFMTRYFERLDLKIP